MNRPIKIVLMTCIAGMVGISFSWTLAKDPKEVYLEAIRKFVSSDEYQCDFTMIPDCELASGQKNSHYSGKIAMKDSIFYYEQGETIGMFGNKYSVMVSKRDKLIVVQNKPSSEKTANFLKGLVPDNMDVEVIELDTSGSLRHFRVLPMEEYPDPFVEYAEVYIDKQGWIVKMTMYYDKAKQSGIEQKCRSLTIVYKNRSSKVSNPELLDPEHYVLFNNNKFQAAPAFKKYEVVSNLNEELK